MLKKLENNQELKEDPERMWPVTDKSNEKELNNTVSCSAVLFVPVIEMDGREVMESVTAYFGYESQGGGLKLKQFPRRTRAQLQQEIQHHYREHEPSSSKRSSPTTVNTSSAPARDPAPLP
ncbi:unnamed protein product [Leuciscus chuanchicus]